MVQPGNAGSGGARLSRPANRKRQAAHLRQQTESCSNYEDGSCAVVSSVATLLARNSLCVEPAPSPNEVGFFAKTPIIGIMNAQLEQAYWSLEKRLAPGLRSAQAIYADVLGRYVDADTCWLDIGCGHQLFEPWINREEAL